MCLGEYAHAHARTRTYLACFRWCEEEKDSIEADTEADDGGEGGAAPSVPNATAAAAAAAAAVVGLGLGVRANRPFRPRRWLITWCDRFRAPPPPASSGPPSPMDAEREWRPLPLL